MKKLTKILASLLLVICVSMCFVGCTPKVEPVQDSLTLKHEFRTVYYQNETLQADTTNGSLTCVKDGQTTTVAITPAMVTNFNTLTTGTRNMIITHEGMTLEVEYTVVDLLKSGEVYGCMVEDKNMSQDEYIFIKFGNNRLDLVFTSEYADYTQVDFDSNNQSATNIPFHISSVLKHSNNGQWTATFNLQVTSSDTSTATLSNFVVTNGLVTAFNLTVENNPQMSNLTLVKLS